MRCIIIDNDKTAMLQLKEILEDISFVTVGGVFADPLEAWIFVKKHPVDLVFSDAKAE